MASKEGKFGTFGGVFTPSLLTILGVIMYMRLPWVVGSAGLGRALGIIVVAHVISVATGLSISSIATDKNVGAGGPYYIVSRSLGLPIGGTLGLALFVGLAFSISLYVIGFSESFLTYFGIEPTLNTIRITGTIVIVSITIVTFISTAFAIKTQYLILTLIALSLLSIFFGSHDAAPANPNWDAYPGSDPLPILFGVFFPAVTGFTAGVNMSGDLENPKRSIPRGTLAAIGTGLVVYLGLAVYVGTRIPAKDLVENQNILVDFGLVPELVVAGVWGATLSSALGSILGSPRIFQAVAADGIAPRFFAKGYGSTNEPRNALVLSFIIGEAGILIGELNVIARVVSMVFLATYGFLNVSCAIESWASPDFRPAFRIPKGVSVVGAITSVIVMIQLDLPAMIGATALMAGLFLYLQRRQLRLDSGDTWEGIWSSLVRSGLYRLSHLTRQQRNWRPNVLAFGARDGGTGALDTIGQSLLGTTGMLTHIEFAREADGARAPPPEARNDEDQLVGVAFRRVHGDDPFEDVVQVCRYHGLAGVEPNTVLLDFGTFGRDPERLADLLARLSEGDLNQLVYSAGGRETSDGPPRVDVWWRSGGGNLALSLSLVRFISSSPWLGRAAVRFVLISEDPANNDILRTTTRRHLSENRVDATVKVINNATESKSFEEWVERESSDAVLTVVGLPNQSGPGDREFLSRMTRLFENLGKVLMIRASSSFTELLSAGRTASISLFPPAPESDGAASLPAVTFPETPDLGRAASDIAEAYEALVRSFDEHCLTRVYGVNIELVRRVRAALERQLALVDRGLSSSDSRRLLHLFNRAEGAFLADAREIVSHFSHEDVHEQQAVLDGRIETFLRDERVRGNPDDVYLVDRARADFEPADGDSPRIRRFKNRRRWLSFKKATVRYAVPLGKLKSHYFRMAVRRLLRETVVRMVADSHQLAVHLGKMLGSSKSSLSALADELAHEPGDGTLASEQRKRALRPYDGLVAACKADLGARRRGLLSETAALLQAMSDDLDRLDVAWLLRSERGFGKDDAATEEELLQVPRAFAANQAALFERAHLAVRVSSFQHRLATVVEREREALARRIETGILHECTSLRRDLTDFSKRLDETDDNEVERPRFELDLEQRLDPTQVIDALTAEANAIIADLPESVRTLADETIERLEEGKLEQVAPVELALRRMAEFLVETELIGTVHEELAKIPDIERRAATVAQDVVRLVGFQLSEFDALGFCEPGDFATHMRPVVENGLERLDAELERLRQTVPEIGRLFERQLALIVEKTRPYELTRSSESLEQYIRVHQSKKAVSGAQGFVRGTARAVRGSMVRLLYRASAGVVLARTLRARAASAGSPVDRVRALVRDNTPKGEVLERLPFFYRQLFLGQSLNETFWVDREVQIEGAERAVAAFDRGAYGAIVITGELGAGKTALCQRIASRVLDGRPAYWVRAPLGGSSEPEDFERALESAIQTGASRADLFERLPEGSAVVIDDLDLWWARSRSGFQVVDLILELVAKHGRRCLFLVGVSSQTLRFLDRFRSLSDTALAVLTCDPMPAELLGSIIMLRHGSTGVTFEVSGKKEGELSQWQLARLYSQHFSYSNGVVGAALMSWLTHVDDASSSSIRIRFPEMTSGEALDELKPEWKALLLQLVLHKQASVSRLRLATGHDRAALERDLGALERMGVVVARRSDVFELNRFLQHKLVERLHRRGLLPP